MTSEQAKAARQAKAEAEDRLAVELARQRTVKLATVGSGIEQLKELLGSVREKIARADDLASHMLGFYEEIDKLAKGRSLLGATDLGVEQANDIVREAKRLIQADPYLDRVKELVPAGDNPLYPDVLLTIRAVQQGLERFQVRLAAQRERIASKLSEAKTIHAALQHYSEYHSIPSIQNVTTRLEGKVASGWFTQDDRGDLRFDIARLDRCNVDEYFSVACVSEADGE
jgi:hypothetical protein